MCYLKFNLPWHVVFTRATSTRLCPVSGTLRAGLWALQSVEASAVPPSAGSLTRRRCWIKKYPLLGRVQVEALGVERSSVSVKTSANR